MLMTVRDEFEFVENESSLLHYNLLSKLDTMIKDLILEEAHVDTL